MESVKGLVQALESGKLNHLKSLKIRAELPENSEELNLTPTCFSNAECLTFHSSTFSMTKLKSITCQPNLQKLDISKCVVNGNLSTILRHRLAFLHTLVLRDCGLKSTDLDHLHEANVSGRLPQLRHLDLSNNNKLIGNLVKIFSARSHWNQLLSLEFQQGLIFQNCPCPDRFSADVDSLCIQAESGRLKALEELSFTAYREDYFRDGTSARWPHLKVLNILVSVSSRCSINSFMGCEILSPVVEMYDQGLLPALRVVNLNGEGYPYDKLPTPHSVLKLRKNGVCVFYSKVYGKIFP